jgi:hypothetical protein
MKKYSLIAFIALVAVSFQAFGQKLEENKKDDFTGKLIKRTSWEQLCWSNSNGHCRFSLVGDSEFLDLKLMIDKVFSIDKDQDLLLKLANGEIVTLKSQDYQNACLGCGATGLIGKQAEGLQTSYLITPEQVAKLKANKIVEVRIQTTEGYIDDNVKDKYAGKVIALLNLL